MDNSDQFSTIINSINTDLTIIIDNKTGFYNITKINNYIYKQNCKQNETMGIPTVSKKNISDWSQNKSSKELIERLKFRLNIYKLKYELEIDIELEYRGTYVHKLLFEQILMWINPEYSIDISIMINQNHVDYNKISKENKLLHEKLDKQSEEINDIKNQNKKLSTQLNNVQETLNEVVEDVVVKTTNTDQSHTSFQLIRTHQTSHNVQIIDFKCMYCDKQFKYKHHLKQHYNRKNACNIVVNTQCFICLKRFSSKDALKKHMNKQIKCQPMINNNTQNTINGNNNVINNTINNKIYINR